LATLAAPLLRGGCPDLGIGHSVEPSAPDSVAEIAPDTHARSALPPTAPGPATAAVPVHVPKRLSRSVVGVDHPDAVHHNPLAPEITVRIVASRTRLRLDSESLGLVPARDHLRVLLPDHAL